MCCQGEIEFEPARAVDGRLEGWRVWIVVPPSPEREDGYHQAVVDRSGAVELRCRGVGGVFNTR